MFRLILFVIHLLVAAWMIYYALLSGKYSIEAAPIGVGLALLVFFKGASILLSGKPEQLLPQEKKGEG